MKLLLPLLLAFISYHTFGQVVLRQQSKIATYNIVFSSLTAGIGSCINKPKNEHFFKAFIRGASRGILGGAVCFAGKKTTYLIAHNNSYYYGWLVKAIHSTGTSIVRNAAFHRGFMEEYTTEFGFIQFSYNFNTAQPSGKIILSRLAGIGVVLSMKGSLDVEKSLKLGHLYFNANTAIASEHNFAGKTIYGIMQISKNSPHIMETTAHELIHTLQTNEFLSFGAYIDKPYSLLNKKYQVFAPELITSYIIFSGFENAFTYSYSRRISEYEAFSLSTNKYVWYR